MSLIKFQGFTMGTVVVGLVVLLACVDADVPTYDRKPFGRKMCDQLCQNILGCVTYAFHISSLHCQVSKVMAGSADKWMFLYNVSQKNEKPAMNQTCVPHSRMFQSRGGQLFCRDKIRVGKTEDGGAWGKRLLVAYLNDAKFYQVNLQNKSVSSYSYIVQRYIFYVLFISSKNSIWISTHTVGILSYPLDNSNYTRIYGTYCVRMAVDKEENLVFLVFKQGRGHSIVTMTTSGKEYKEVCKVNKYFRDIAVLQKDQLIAVSCSNLEIIQYGRKTVRKVLATNKWHFDYLTVTPNDNTLYFTSNKNVFKISLNDYKITQVASFTSRLHQLMYYDNRLIIPTYNIWRHEGNIRIMDINTKANQVLVIAKSRVTAMGILP